MSVEHTKAQKLGLTGRLVYVTIFSSMASAGYGFDMGWIAGALTAPQFTEAFGYCDAATDTCAMSNDQLSYGTGTASAGLIIGIFLGAWLNERYGRRWAIMAHVVIVIIGIVIECASFSFGILTAGRVLASVAGGIAANVVPIYLAECAPPALRGALTACYNIFLLIGSTLSAAILLACRNIQGDWAFRTVFVLQLLVPATLGVGWFWLPESPRWLVKRGRADEAVTVIRDFRPADHAAEEEVRLLELQLEEERRIQSGSNYMDCFRGTNLRRTIIAIGPQVLQQAQGIAFMANYLSIFLMQLGFSDILRLLVILYSIGVVANIVSFFTNDTIGRRASLLYSSVVLAITMFATAGLSFGGIAALSTTTSNAITAMLMIWFFVFQLTWGPLAWVIASEIPTAQVREKTVSLSAFGSYGCSLIINFVNPYVQGAIDSKVTFIYGGFSMVALVFVFFVVPESKGRSLEELDDLFNDRVPARKFGSHVCTGLGAEIAGAEKNGNTGSVLDTKAGVASPKVEHAEA